MKIVRALVQQMAATLDIKSAPSSGAEFIVTIPLRAS
jgi:signal transduction histidine kinase